MGPKRSCANYAFVATLLVCTSHAYAEEIKPSLVLGAGIEYDDNVYRVDDNKESDEKLFFKGSAGLQKSGEWYRLSLSYSGNKSNYVNDSYRDQSVVNGQSRLLLGASNSWFSWSFSNTEQSTVIDVLNPDTTDNRSQRSIFTTGPQVRFMLSPVDTFFASYTYSQVSVGGSEADSENISTSASLSHRVSKTLSVGIQASSAVIKPDVDNLFFLEGDNEYRQDRGSLFLQKTIKKGSVSLSYGESKLNGVKNITETSGNDYSLVINRKFDFGTLAVSYGQSLTNSGFGGDIAAGLESILGSEVFDIQESEYWQTSYASPKLLNNTVLYLKARKSSIDTLTRDLKETRQDYQVQLVHDFSEHTKITLSVSYQDNDFNGSAESSKNSYSLGGSHQLNRKLRLGCGIVNETGSGSRRYDVLNFSCNASWQIF